MVENGIRSTHNTQQLLLLMDAETRAAEEQAVERPQPPHLRYFNRRVYSIDEKHGDQYVLQHMNGLCIVGVAPSHAMLQGHRQIARVTWRVKESGPQGKHKKQTLNVSPSTVLCTVTCDDGSEHDLQSLVAGQLLELNDLLAENPGLVKSAPYQEGFIAVVSPRRENLDTCTSHLMSAEDYDAAIAARPLQEAGHLADDLPDAKRPSVLGAQDGKTLVFIGVTTGSSFVNRLFPVWAPILGIPDARITGLDLPVDVDRATARQEIERLQCDQSVRGALITSHKISVYAAAADLFETLDEDAKRLGEMSCIARTPSGGLAGYAVDSATSTSALRELGSPTHWSDNPTASVVIMGAGGAGIAIATSLLRWPSVPSRILLTDVSQDRLAHAEDVLQGLSSASGALEFRLVSDPSDHDALLADMQPRSLIINATGMGKDRPGSPIGSDKLLPEGCIVWELNYRGERLFLQTALAQAAERSLTVADGWEYFLLGWSTVISIVFGIPLTPELFGRLRAAAEDLRAATAS